MKNIRTDFDQLLLTNLGVDRQNINTLKMTLMMLKVTGLFLFSYKTKAVLSENSQQSL
jgi:hypothetical protein